MRLRRRRLLIDMLQVRLLLQAWAYILVALVACALIVFSPLVVELRTIDASGGDPNGTATRFLELHRTFWPVIAVVFLLTGIHSILVSHRIAGPIYRLRVTLDAIADGKPVRPVRLRRNDYLMREAAALNRVIARLQAMEPSADSTPAESRGEALPAAPTRE